ASALHDAAGTFEAIQCCWVENRKCSLHCVACQKTRIITTEKDSEGWEAHDELTCTKGGNNNTIVIGILQ
ncbi:MAG: hypothetical protein QQN41_07320, partial [Nitrosopumilus sp.]